MVFGKRRTISPRNFVVTLDFRPGHIYTVNFGTIWNDLDQIVVQFIASVIFVIIFMSCRYYCKFIVSVGNVARALSMTNELLELVPTHERALGNRAYYQKEIQSKASQSKKKRGEDGQDDTAVPAQVRQREITMRIITE